MSDQNKRVLLSVLAHPDDETFGMGGTLALYARQGVEVHLICATRGEVGEVDERFLRGFNSIGERREAELRCAAEKLGLTAVHFLNYRDSGMPGSPDNSHPDALAFADPEKVAAEVAHYIRMLKPQVVLTFDPIGGYRHPDHIAIHNATVKAFYAAADPAEYPDGLPGFQPDKLYFHVFPKFLLKMVVTLMPLIGKDPHKIGRNKDIDLASIAKVSFPIHARINYLPVAEIREEASACHESQGGVAMTKGFIASIRRRFTSFDSFMQAYPTCSTKKRTTDLFANY